MSSFEVTWRYRVSGCSSSSPAAGIRERDLLAVPRRRRRPRPRRPSTRPSPRAGSDVAGALSIEQEVHGDQRELERRASLQEQDRAIVGTPKVERNNDSASSWTASYSVLRWLISISDIRSR